LIRPENESIANSSDVKDWETKAVPNSGSNVLGIVMFAIVFGIIIGKMDETEGNVLKDFFRSLTNAIMKITVIVIQLTPIAVLFLVLTQVLSVENVGKLIESVGWYALTVIIGVLIHGLIVLPSLYILLTRNNPYKFIIRMSAAILTAFGTSSSSATMPVRILNLMIGFS
jgi:solute carrier family 1 (high affinity glutamate transporter) protein 3